MAGDSVVNFSEYTDAISRRWPLVVAATIAGAVLGYAALSTRSATYESVARVEVRPLIANGAEPNLDVARQVNTTTERAIANSQRVAELAERLLQAQVQLQEVGANGNIVRPSLDSPEVEELAEEIVLTPEDVDRVLDTLEFTEVFVPTNTQILQFTSTAGKADVARDRAGSTAHAYLNFRAQNGFSGIADARQQLLDREAELLVELDELSTLIKQAGEDEARIQALSYRDISKRQELSGIGSSLAKIDAISVNAGTILDDAELPTNTVGIPPIAGPVSGGLLGMIAGIAAALLVNRGDDRVRDPRAELANLGLNVFGNVPVASISNQQIGVALFPVDDAGTEAYRRVQGGLLFDLDRTDKSVVLVAGTRNATSATTVAANLAIAAARAGRQVLLVGADLRNPALHDRLGIGNTRGLSDVLLGEATLEDVTIQLPELPNLRVVTAGKTVNPPTPLLQGKDLGIVISKAKAEYSLVIFEAPPVLNVADAVDIGRICEGAVLVVEPSRATRSDVADSVEELRRVGSEVIGTILADRAAD